MSPQTELLHLYISPAHNYFGHHGKPPGRSETVEVTRIECIANRGIEGDRFFDYKDHYKGQITFFAQEVYENVCEQLKVWDKSPATFRRNVITRGIDLNELIGKEFTLQGVTFMGIESCKPCYWMDQAFAPGAETALHGRGGLRARILTSGVLATTINPPANLELVASHER